VADDLNISGGLNLTGVGEQRNITIKPGGSLIINEGATLDMTAPTPGTLTTDGAGIDMRGGTLTVDREIVSESVSIADGIVNAPLGMTVDNLELKGGQLDMGGNVATINNSLTLGYTMTIDSEQPMTASGANLLESADVVVNGGTLTITGPPTYPEGAVGIWTFDDKNDLGHDSSGNEHHGNLLGDPSAVAGKLGGAISLDGTGDYVEIPYPDDFNFTEAVTVSVWINVAAFDTNWQAIVAKGEGNRWRLHRHNNNSYLNWNASGDLDSTMSPTIGQWYHLVAVHNEAHELLLYVDGELNAGPISGSAMGTSTASVMIGNNPNSTAREFNGLIDDVAIYGRGLTPDDVNALYGDGNGPSSGEEVSLTSTNLLVTADTEITSEATSLMFGDLTLADATRLTLSGPSFSFKNMTVPANSTVELPTYGSILKTDADGTLSGSGSISAGEFTIGGVISPGSAPGEIATLTLDAYAEMIDSAVYRCDIGTAPGAWPTNPPVGRYASEEGSDMIESVHWLGLVMAGTLELSAVGKLHEQQGGKAWYGEEDRFIAIIEGEDGVWFESQLDYAPDEHLGHGVFLRDPDEGDGLASVLSVAGEPYDGSTALVGEDVVVHLWQAGPGDVNADNKVDFSDVWQLLTSGKYNQPDSATWPEGDVSGDGLVDFNDVWSLLTGGLYNQGDYGEYPLNVKGAGVEAVAADLTVVPEPGTLVMLAAGALALLLLAARFALPDKKPGEQDPAAMNQLLVQCKLFPITKVTPQFSNRAIPGPRQNRLAR